MSRRLVSQIEKLPIPAKHKRALEGWAAFANNDGTNIYPSKKAVGGKKSVSRWTIYRNSDALLEAGVLFKATSHVCKNPDCRGPKHYWSNGHWTQVYNLDVAMLQNATLLKEKLCSILLREQRSKMPKSNVAKGDATQGSTPTPPAVGENNSSAVTSREGRNEGKNEGSSVRSAHSAQRVAPLEPSTKEKPPEPMPKKRRLSNPLPQWVCPLDQPMTEEEDEQVNGDIYGFWDSKTGIAFLLYDPTQFGGTGEEFSWGDHNAGVRMVREYGFESVMDTLTGTWECPKLAKYAWKDFSYWCEHYLETRSTLMAWRNKMEAQQQANARVHGR